MNRISNLAALYNISTTTIITELNKVLSKNFNPSTKLNDEEIKIIKEAFAKDLENKTASYIRIKTSYVDVDTTFIIDESECKIFPKEVADYNKNFVDIELLKNKKDRFWALENIEIELLLKAKWQNILKIQKIIKENRTVEMAYEPRTNDIDNFYFGGLSGEEASIAYWNCD